MPAVPKRTPQIGIVTGLQFERAILMRARNAPSAPALDVVCAAADYAAAERLSERLVASGAKALVSFGIAGALDISIRPGDLVLPQRILGEDGTDYACDTRWRERLHERICAKVACIEAPLVTVKTPAATAAVKRELLDRHGAMAVDMESAAVGAVAARHRLPFLTVRAIADSADQDVPSAALSASLPDGSVSAMKALTGVIRHPLQLAALLRLGRQTGRAKTTLTCVADLVLPGFVVV
jgi:adenosylhomocysteine nucleosidase